MKCLEIARLKDFAPNTPGLLGVAKGPQTPCREVRDSRCVSTNPPLEIPVYGPGFKMISIYIYDSSPLILLITCNYLVSLVKKMGEFGGQNAHSTLNNECESGA